LGLVGIEDKDARRIARMSRSRAQGDAGRQGGGPRISARGPDAAPWRPPPPREGRDPYSARQQPPRQQPPRQQMPMRDQQRNGGQRFGANAEAAMPRLPSPRWSGQGRILGRPDIKVRLFRSMWKAPGLGYGPALGVVPAKSVDEDNAHSESLLISRSAGCRSGYFLRTHLQHRS